MANEVYGFCEAGCRYPVATKKLKTITLFSANWNESVQTVKVDEVTADGSQAVIVSPAPASSVAYNSAGVKCSSESEGSLTFSCDSIPTANLVVNVLILS